MAQSKNIQVAIVQETVANTYEAPAAGADFIEMADIPTRVTDQEVVERTVVRGSLGRLKARRGSKLGNVDLPLELKSSNSITTSHTDEPRLMQLFDALLGTKITTSANDTATGGGHTTTVVNTTANDYTVGEVVLINDEVRHVKAVGTGPDSITLNIALSAPPIDTDIIYRGHTAAPDSADARRYSITTYNQPDGTAGWEEQFIGSVITNGSFEDITNGAIPKVNFTFDSVDWEVDANITNAIAPVFEDSTPPDNLGVYMNIGGTVVDSNNLSLTVDKAVTPQNVITKKSGILSRVPTDRNISGSFDYFPGDTDATLFDLFENNTTTEMQFSWFECDASDNPIQGTIISVYLPRVQIQSGSPEDEDGFEKRVGNFNAFETATLDSEIFVGFL